MTTIGTLFSGFGGVDIGAQAAGLELAWGVEFDADIAAVAHANLPHDIRVANLLDCDPRTFEAVDVLHASPPCPSFSIVSRGKETALDISLGRKTAEFLTVLAPQIFTLENVWAYRHSKSWRIIEDALHRAGYWISVEHCNSADFGVPQTRRRMIVRAIKGGFVPYMPEAVEWVGWYDAIKDLIPTLPPSKFAPWQMKRLPQPLKSVLIASDNAGQEWGKLYKDKDEPAMTVSISSMPRAFIMQVQGEGGDGRQASRALLATGRVVSMTPRCLARFQSFPNWYELPDSNRLAAKGIGNAVPPLMMQRIYEGLEAML